MKTINATNAGAALIAALPCAALASVDAFADLSNQMLGVNAVSVSAVSEFELLQDTTCVNEDFLAGTIFKGFVEYDYDGSDWRLFSHVSPDLTDAMSVESIKRNGELTTIDYNAGYANTIPLDADRQPEGPFQRIPTFSIYDYLDPFDADSFLVPTVPSLQTSIVQTTSHVQTWTPHTDGGRQLLTTSINLATAHGVGGQNLTISTLQAEPGQPFRYEYTDQATGNPILRIEFSNYQTITHPDSETSVWPMSIQQTVYGPDGEPAIIATHTVQTLVINNQTFSSDRIDNREIPAEIALYYEDAPVEEND